MDYSEEDILTSLKKKYGIVTIKLGEHGFEQLLNLTKSRREKALIHFRCLTQSYEQLIEYAKSINVVCVDLRCDEENKYMGLMSGKEEQSLFTTFVELVKVTEVCLSLGEGESRFGVGSNTRNICKVW